VVLHHVYSQALDFESPLTRLAAWGRKRRCAALISDGGPKGRFSYLCADPVAVFADAQAKGHDALDQLAALTKTYAIAPHNVGHFSGGIIGVAAFELGLRLEQIEAAPFCVTGATWPDMMAFVFDRVLVFDHHERTLRVFGRGATDAQAKAACQALVAHYLSLPRDDVPIDGALSEAAMQGENSDEAHAQKVATVIEKIHEGALFQANMARSWTGQLKKDIEPIDLFLRLCRDGAAPFGAFFRLDDLCVVSNSPERFIDGDSDGNLLTQPIKGTRPRGHDGISDAALAAALLSSEKDRAENLMIVDLMRHDFAKVAKVGTVKVTALHQLESYAHVHHLVSTVTARLMSGLGLADVLRATFPAGSITGAPKVQAMKLIASMDAPRGPYCGSLFCLDFGGAFQSNVLIRTLAFEYAAQKWHYCTFAGGGIVADSDPVSETEETHTKIATIRAVLD
jgi:para-aminobenzoate synthetase component 1